jgi:hypothetical protein
MAGPVLGAPGSRRAAPGGPFGHVCGGFRHTDRPAPQAHPRQSHPAEARRVVGGCLALPLPDRPQGRIGAAMCRHD